MQCMKIDNNSQIGAHVPKGLQCSLSHTRAQGVKQSVCLSVVIVVARSRVQGIFTCCKHKESVDINETGFLHTVNGLLAL